MKKFSVIIAAVIALAFTAPLFAGDADIIVFRPAVNPRDKKDPMVMAAEKYKAETGGKVTFVQSDWGNWPSKIMQYLAAGTPIDVFFGNEENFPRFFTRGYTQPLDDYVDLTKPYVNLKVMDTLFKYEGKYHLVSNKTSNHAWAIIFNKTLMEEEGIAPKDMPDALYQNGKWTMDAMAALAKKLTKDTDKDGNVDRWGVGTFWTEGFLYMNGVSLASYDSKGQFKLTFDDPRVLQSLTYLYKAKQDGWYQPDNAIASVGLQRRTVAMFLERLYMVQGIKAETKDEIVAVPLPYGPGNKDKKNVLMADGYCIGKGSKKQVYAGKYINYCLEVWYNNWDVPGRAKWPKEVLALQDEMAKNQYTPQGTLSPLESIKNQLLGEIVWSGQQPSTVLENYRPIAQGLIDDANTPAEPPKQLPFKEFTLDFEDGNVSMFKVQNAKQTSVKISATKDEKLAIKDTSMLIEMDSKKDGDHIYVISDIDKIFAVGWRNYMISFDMKMITDPPAKDTNISIELYQGEKSKYGLIGHKIDEKDATYAVSGVVRDVQRNGKFALRIDAYKGAAFVIDNIKVKEVK